MLLNDWRVRNGIAPIDVDGIVGPETLGAITSFERRFTAFSDSRIDPNGPTLQKLKQFHLEGVLSGTYSATVTRLSGVRQRDPSTATRLFDLYLKALRQASG
jgi:hypothetical protein